MRLADFILHDMEAILLQWDAFAATTEPAKGMTKRALRDHAREILQAVAKDIDTAQSRQAQSEKSKGRAPHRFDAPETAAQTHATLRAQSGFDIEELASEYRALRASVMRLWADRCGTEALNVEDMIRFNEAIDQALAESIEYFSCQVEQSRNLLLGMLSHDMRSPLQTILLTAGYLAALKAGAEVSTASSRLIKSGARMKSLLEDLVDFNRTELGLGINIDSREVDLQTLFADEVEMQRGANPERTLELQFEGSTRGHWDGLRLQQLLGNLVQNAVKYGDADSPIVVKVMGRDDEVLFEVVNRGPAIESSIIEVLFNPLQRGPVPAQRDENVSMGLGLYITREIARAHGGDISARSSESETVFSVRLPRKVEAPAAG
jgi:signal transduction histidine kinase